MISTFTLQRITKWLRWAAYASVPGAFLLDAWMSSFSAEAGFFMVAIFVLFTVTPVLFALSYFVELVYSRRLPIHSWMRMLALLCFPLSISALIVWNLLPLSFWERLPAGTRDQFLGNLDVPYVPLLAAAVLLLLASFVVRR